MPDKPTITAKVVRATDAFLAVADRLGLGPEEKMLALQLAAARLVVTGTGDLRVLLEASADEMAAGVRGIGGHLLTQMEKLPVRGRA